MEKKKYIEPKLRIVWIDSNDIIATSNTGATGDDIQLE